MSISLPPRHPSPTGTLNLLIFVSGMLTPSIRISLVDNNLIHDSSLSRTVHRCAALPLNEAPSAKLTSYMGPVGCGNTPVTVIGVPRLPMIVSPTLRSPFLMKPVGDGIGVSNVSALPAPGWRDNSFAGYGYDRSFSFASFWIS